MENRFKNEDLNGQGYLFNKNNWLKPIVTNRLSVLKGEKDDEDDPFDHVPVKDDDNPAHG